MVIQGNMSPKAIVEIWDNTGVVFEKHQIPLTEEALDNFLDTANLAPLLIELNTIVGSSTTTCIEGG